jgi:hypothetical protein
MNNFYVPWKTVAYVKFGLFLIFAKPLAKGNNQTPKMRKCAQSGHQGHAFTDVALRQ